MGRPIYPRTQYNIPRAHVTMDAMHPGKKVILLVCTYVPTIVYDLLNPFAVTYFTVQQTPNGRFSSSNENCIVELTLFLRNNIYYLIIKPNEL